MGVRPSPVWWVRYAWRSLADRMGWNMPPMPDPDQDFVATTRTMFDPIASEAGFTFNMASAGMGTGSQKLRSGPPLPPRRADMVGFTNVLYEAVPEEFAASHPGLVADLDEHGPCIDLWINLDMDHDIVEVDVVQFYRVVPRGQLGEVARELRDALRAAASE